MTPPRFALVLLFVCAAGLASSAFSSSADQPVEWQQHDHIQVALVHTKTGESSYNIGVLFKPADGWHVYWKNAGDTGLPPEIQWQSQDLTFEGLNWPFPEAIPFNHLVNYGYHHETLIFSEAKVANRSAGNAPADIPLTANVEWLVCKDSCVPGKATLKTKIPAATPQDTLAQDRFEQTKTLLPQSQPLMGSKFSLENNRLKLDLYATSLLFKDAKSVEVFPVQQDIIAYSSPPQVYWKKNLLRWEQNVSEYFSQLPDTLDIVVVVDRQKAFIFTLDKTTLQPTT